MTAPISRLYWSTDRTRRPKQTHDRLGRHVGLGPGRETLVTPSTGCDRQTTDNRIYSLRQTYRAARQLTLHATDNRVEIDRATHA
jgi:hypothetical protein